MRRSARVLTALAIGIATVGLVAAATTQAAKRDLGRETLPANDGWGAYSTTTTGGAAATAAHVYTVTNRAELINALYDGGTRISVVPKIIYVKGVIDANVDDNNQPLTCADYARNGYTLEAYLAAFDPAVWPRGNGVPTGPLEDARKASYLAQEGRVRLRVGSNTTIVGVDRNAAIKGGWFDVRTATMTQLDGKSKSTVPTNIIIRNLRFIDTFDCFPQWDPTDGSAGNWNSQYDSVSIRNGDHVWVDHNEFADVETKDEALPYYFGRLYQVHDGQLDITNAADFVTVSWNVFKDHDKVMLIGSSDSSTPTKYADYGKLNVTLHHNVFDNTGQRGPRVRFGKVHIYNDMYRVKGNATYQYSWLVGQESAIYAENNFFRVEEGVQPSDFISVSKGTRIKTVGNLVNAAAANHEVDIRDAYNAANGASLSEDVGWTPTLFIAIDPAFKVPSLTASQSGPFNW